ncbi:MAG TPA: MYG1 family protein [Verrucomicrobiales bacterium]|nr:MYG1 family protein [Verrucomicrobiales bacterium]
MKAILTHPGSSHKDDFLACCLLVARHGVPVWRRDPTDEDLADPQIAVVDVGGEHDPKRSNFDHHQFPRDHEPVCALSLVLQDLGLYEDARSFCEWLEPAEWFDTRGPFATAEWLGVDRSLVNRLNSPVDITLLRRFAQKRELVPGDPIWEVMRMVGEDLFMYLRTLRERLDYVAEKAMFLDVGEGDDSVRILFMPRTDPMPDDPSSSLGRYIDSVGEKVAGLIYPDRRGDGYGLSRHEDSPLLDFTRIVDEADVHFAHARGFVAKTSATSLQRLTELVEQAKV